MSHFHVAQPLLASIDGELCGLLRQVNKEANDDRQTFDKKWMPHFAEAAEAAEADAEEAAAVRLAFVKPKPKTKKCSLMGGRIKRKSKKRNSS